MFALNETATLFPCIGQSGGKPAYAENGTTFHCRSEHVQNHAFIGTTGGAVQKGADTRIFAQGVTVNPGDRIDLNDKCYLVREVSEVRGFRSVHHLEILAKEM